MVAEGQTKQKTCFFAKGRADLRATTEPDPRPKAAGEAPKKDLSC
ncbi:hypothetical protein SGRA_0202 [Saprospira grandis str. Lewin]|uniref:Uncharacterized protein n=1 Tax=Saprospira grandis (strain Lewin) TaxID=984262 RepID=H6L642_SAPGL|nr:hypothetical protein SGRA_0202 [Saprospira grandis str. Lewin]